MAKKHLHPSTLYADDEGNIFDAPGLSMLCRRGRTLAPPRPDELIPLPPGSDVFLLPGRNAVGLDPETGRVEGLDERAVTAFVCPGYTLSATAAFLKQEKTCRLPLFAYGAVGFANGRFYVTAKRVDTDPRQDFTRISEKRIRAGATRWLSRFPENRLVHHLSRCALTYGCPAAKNLALGRYEAPLPTSRVCNASCVGCISQQPDDSGFPATQNRISFLPSSHEIVEIMLTHEKAASKPIYSFGQGCEGEPLTEADRISEAISLFRAEKGTGTVNMNTNGSIPRMIPKLAASGLDSFRVSLNSARPELYLPYYRPKGFGFGEVRSFLTQVKESSLFLSLNYLFSPGVNDTEEELAGLLDLLLETRPDLIQLRNLNLDPDLYLDLVPDPGPSMGLANFMRRIKKECPWIRFGYFNPFVDRENLES
ncbi:MAG: radical SAM protein [Desulfovibrionales bacterium]